MAIAFPGAMPRAGNMVWCLKTFVRLRMRTLKAEGNGAEAAHGSAGVAAEMSVRPGRNVVAGMLRLPPGAVEVNVP
jgi:hypothetical protein